jgi:hypothetical protein
MGGKRHKKRRALPLTEVNVTVRQAPRVVKDQIHIIVSSEEGVMDLESLAEASVSSLGKQVSLDVSYAGAERIVGIDLKIRPNDVGRELYDVLRRFVETIENNKGYRKVMNYFGDYDQYLGEWKSGEFPFRNNVGECLKRVFEYTEERWGVTREQLLSSDRTRNVSRVRKAAYCVLKRNFPNVYNDGGKRGIKGLSTDDIGKIFGGRSHSLFVVFSKDLKGIISNSKVKDPSLVEMVLEEAVKALGGIA